MPHTELNQTDLDQTDRTDETPAETDFDDGLVHDHSWACSERGAPAI